MPCITIIDITSLCFDNVPVYSDQDDKKIQVHKFKE